MASKRLWQLGQFVYLALVLLLSLVGFLLSLWIVVPAPTLALLPLAVGAPEVSPWLLVLNAIALLLSLVLVARLKLLKLALVISLIGLGLSALPLLQLPFAQQKFAVAMQQTLGSDYLAQIPSQKQQVMRSQPFSWVDSFRGIESEAVRSTLDIPFAAPEGEQLTLNVYRPVQAGTYPAIVVIYGGAWRSGSPAANVDFSRYMAAQGYTVFAIDYRHAPRYQFPAQLEDVQSALRFIREHAAEYEADPTRMALLGRSAGGHLAMLAAYQPDAPPLRAVVSYYGPFNLAAGYNDPPRPDPLDVRAILRNFLGGTPSDRAEQYRSASVTTYVDLAAPSSLPPTLLIHGGRDHIVQAKFARGMQQRLRKAGNTALLLEVPWAEHAFDAVFQGPSNQLALYYVERFLAWALR